jgi:catechol 2,3-dioxygenase-like lactoylglutathione lyase family enzyme
MSKFKFKGLNHITLRVNNIEKAEQFYTDILGFEIEKKMGRSMTVYRIGKDSLVLVEAETEYEKTSKDYRVDHFGFFVDSPARVDELAAFFREQEVTILSGPSNRKNGRFVFISDPDGNMIEIFNEA